MTLGTSRRPFSMTVVKHANVTSSATNFMITRAPWPAPANKYYVLRKVVVTSTNNATSGGVLTIWDQDLSNTTPIARGSSSSPLLSIPLPMAVSGQVVGGGPASMTILADSQTPQEYFQAGITCQANVGTNGVLVSLELDVV